MYVYILSTYDEYGAENVHATLDRSNLMKMAHDFYSYPHDKEWLKPRYDELRIETKNGLEKILAQSDEELEIKGGNNCMNGWGGLQIHVVKLVI